MCKKLNTYNCTEVTQRTKKIKRKKKYSIILADPAWSFKYWSQKGNGRSACGHYGVMTLEDLKRLPVSAIASNDAVLFIWVIFSLLPQALQVISAWGFDYKTCGFTWVKRNKIAKSWFWGMGYYTRANAEICLLATKGKGLRRISRSVHSVIDTPIENHSKKPDVVRDKIVELFGDLPRIELFARQKTKGWDALGNDIDGKDIRVAMEEIITKQNTIEGLKRDAT